ncbi:hypothetical protein Tco_1193640 [Tanacetum coccineum]
MDDPNITMKEYARLQTEEAQRHDFEADFPAIVYNDALTSNDNVLPEPAINMAPLPPRAQRNLWLRYQVEGYTEEIVHVSSRDYTQFSIDRISDTKLRLDGADTLCFYLGGARCTMTWRQFILALGLHTVEEMAEDGFEAYWLGSTRVIPNKGDLRDYCTEISSNRDFLGVAHAYTFIRDPEPQPPPAAALTRTMAQRLSRLKEEVHSLCGDMGEQREVLDSMSYDFARFTKQTAQGQTEDWRGQHLSSSPVARPLISFSLTLFDFYLCTFMTR